MPAYTKIFARESIDDELFVPLSNLFLNDNYDPNDLEERILASKHPRYRNPRSSIKRQSKSLDNYRGYVLEKSIQWSLSRYIEELSLFFPNQLTSRVILDYLVNLNIWGNIFFYNSFCRFVPNKALVGFKI